MRFVAMLLCMIGLGEPVEALENDSLCRPVSGPIGLSVWSSLGATFWTQAVARDTRPGFAIRLGLAYEPFSFLAVEAGWLGGFQDTQQPVPPRPGSLTTQAWHGSLRLGWPVGTFDWFMRGGYGWMAVGPNRLPKVPGVDGRWHASWLGGLGMRWHTARRTLWLGFELTALGQPVLPEILLVSQFSIGFSL